MLHTFAHAGHAHDMVAMNESAISDIDHCMPIIVGAGLIIALLLGVIVYLLVSKAAKNTSTSAQIDKPKK